MMSRSSAADRRPRGASLIEVLVAVAIFSAVLVTVVRIDRTGRDAFRKNEAESGAWRQAMLAVEHLKRELRGARITLVEPGRVVLQTPLLDGATPKVSASAEIVYAPDSIELTLDGQKRLVARQAGQRNRVLAELGPEGALRFELPEPRLLRVFVRAHLQDRPGAQKLGQSRYAVQEDFFLPNQP